MKDVRSDRDMQPEEMLEDDAVVHATRATAMRQAWADLDPHRMPAVHGGMRVADTDLLSTAASRHVPGCMSATDCMLTQFALDT